MMDKAQPKDAQPEKKDFKPLNKVEEYQLLWEQMLKSTDVLIQKIRGRHSSVQLDYDMEGKLTNILDEEKAREPDQSFSR
jgi:hypothetical protein